MSRCWRDEVTSRVPDAIRRKSGAANYYAVTVDGDSYEGNDMTTPTHASAFTMPDSTAGVPLHR